MGNKIKRNTTSGGSTSGISDSSTTGVGGSSTLGLAVQRVKAKPNIFLPQLRSAAMKAGRTPICKM